MDGARHTSVVVRSKQDQHKGFRSSQLRARYVGPISHGSRSQYSLMIVPLISIIILALWGVGTSLRVPLVVWFRLLVPLRLREGRTTTSLHQEHILSLMDTYVHHRASPGALTLPPNKTSLNDSLGNFFICLVTARYPDWQSERRI